jgi:hypothetical protein
LHQHASPKRWIFARRPRSLLHSAQALRPTALLANTHTLCSQTRRIQDTRKTAPGLRLLDKWAVALGGGTPHRMGLFDMMMIKDNHIAAAGGIRCVGRGLGVVTLSVRRAGAPSVRVLVYRLVCSLMLPRPDLSCCALAATLVPARACPAQPSSGSG